MKYNTLKDKKVVSENSENIQFDKTVDVVVLGLGTAGPFSALQAAREGLSVIGIEPHSYAGGVGTGGCIHSYYHGTRGGLQTEIDEKVKDIDEVYAQDGVDGWHPCSKKFVLEDEMLKAGVDIYYQSIVLGVYVDDKTVVGCKVLTPEGILTIKAAVTIDGSGDAHAAAMVGCEFKYGRHSDKQAQPYSFPRLMRGDKGRIRHANFDAGIVDPRDGKSISKAICFSQTLHLEEKFNDDLKLFTVASHLGLREGRFIVGEDSVSFDDLLLYREKEQAVLPVSANHDIHSLDLSLESDLAQAWTIVCNFWQKTISTEVPMGALIPKGWDGILVVGRCIALDHDSSQSIRMQRDMQKLGEISGLMAAISKKSNTSLKDLPYEQLRKRLLDSGCLYDFKDKLTPHTDFNSMDDLMDNLNSNNPSDGLWYVKNADRSIEYDLEIWLRNAEDENLKKSAAIALALRGDKKGADTLIRIIEERDEFLPETRLRLTYPRYFAAIYLVGYLGIETALPTLKELLLNKDENIKAREHAYAAIAKIGASNSNATDECKSVLKEFHQIDDDKMIIPLHGWGNMRPQDTEYDYKERLSKGHDHLIESA